MEIVSEVRSHGGRQLVCTHSSAATRTPMTFSIFLPPQVGEGKMPVVWYLSGLTCTHANVTEKGEYRAACAIKILMLLFTLTLSSCIGVGYSSRGGWFVWPGGLGLLIVIIIVILFLRRRR